MTVTWEKFEYGPNDIAWQRECPHCEHGLLLAPARFCPVCGGSGYIVKWQREIPAEDQTV